jgi:hypothetical protein
VALAAASAVVRLRRRERSVDGGVGGIGGWSAAAVRAVGWQRWHWQRRQQSVGCGGVSGRSAAALVASAVDWLRRRLRQRERSVRGVRVGSGVSGRSAAAALLL